MRKLLGLSFSFCSLLRKIQNYINSYTFYPKGGFLTLSMPVWEILFLEVRTAYIKLEGHTAFTYNKHKGEFNCSVSVCTKFNFSLAGTTSFTFCGSSTKPRRAKDRVGLERSNRLHFSRLLQ